MSRIVCLLAVAGFVTSGTSAVAQGRLVATIQGGPAEVVNEYQSKSDARVSFSGRDVTTETALTTIAKQAGLGIAVDRTRVQLAQRISVDIVDLPVGWALELLGQQSGLQIKLAPNGSTIMVARGERAAVQGAITGKVIHAKTKQPIIGATISLSDGGKGVVTGADGLFRLPVARAGDFTLHVKALGFVRASVSTTVADGETVSVEVVMEPSASVLDEVVVTGTVIATERRAISTPITVITAEDIEARGITRVEQLFRGEVPGVLALESGTRRYMSNQINGRTDSLERMVGSEMYVRGNASVPAGATDRQNPLKTYVDGVEILDASYLGTLDPNSIERIEIITGPQAATVYGSGAMGGVMQIFTKRGQQGSTPEIRMSLQYGVLQNNFSQGKTPVHQHRLNVMGGVGSLFSYAGTLSHGYTGQWQPGLYQRTFGASLGVTHTVGPVTGTGTFGATGGSNGTIWGRVVRSSPLDTKLRQTGERPPESSGVFTQRIFRSHSQNAALNMTYRSASAWTHQLTAGRSQTTLSLVPQAPMLTRPSDTLYMVTSSNGHRTTLGYNTTFRIGAGNVSSSVTLGANGSWGEQVRYSGCQVSLTASTVMNCDGGTGAEVTKPFETASWGGFTSVQIGLFNHVYITSGLRGEQNPTYGEEHKIDWAPTNGVSYAFDIGLLTVKLLGSYGKATRAPNPEMRRYIVAVNPAFEPAQYVSQAENLELTPEYSRGPQGGVELFYGNIGSLTINRYYQRVENLIQQLVIDTTERICLGLPGCDPQYNGQISRTGVLVFQYQNVATVKQYGWEGTGSVSFGGMQAAGSYSWNESRIIHNGAHPMYDGSSYMGIPTHTGNIRLTYSSGGSSVSLMTSYIGATNQRWSPVFSQPGSARLETYLPARGVESIVSLPGYKKSDLSVSHRFALNTSVTLRIVNLGNNFVSDVGDAFPTLGRQTNIGVSYTFR